CIRRYDLCTRHSFCSTFSSPYRHHRDLHSFPTRRSSDLIAQLQADNAAADFVERRHEQQAASSQKGDVAGNPFDLGDLVAGNDEDRKSTRLNSSHGSISYAVFCLKKKKEKKT